MFEPRPEIRTATRFFAIGLQLEIERAVIGDTLLAASADYAADGADRLAGLGEGLAHRRRILRRDDDDHADAAVEGAQHFLRRDVADLGQPAEHRRRVGLGQVYARAETLRQHARNVVGEAAAGDVGEALDRAGFADRGEAGFHIDAGRRQA